MENTLNKAYEWVVNCKDEEFVLTERQYEFLIDNQTERFVAFDDFGLQPAMIAWFRKREAQTIKMKYPCKECGTNGYILGDAERKPCPKCKGTGVDLS